MLSKSNSGGLVPGGINMATKEEKKMSVRIIRGTRIDGKAVAPGKKPISVNASLGAELIRSGKAEAVGKKDE